MCFLSQKQSVSLNIVAIAEEKEFLPGIGWLREWPAFDCVFLIFGPHQKIGWTYATFNSSHMNEPQILHFQIFIFNFYLYFHFYFYHFLFYVFFYHFFILLNWLILFQ